MAAPLKNILKQFFRSRFYQLTLLSCNESRLASTEADNPHATTSKEKISKAMKAYLERAKAHEEFMKQEKHDFNIGRRHLANMMGAESELITQEEIDKSIQYLLPSGLFEPKARPTMKPPEEIFPKTKAAEFDYCGRPHHYLFYTTRPFFSSLLHECSNKLNELDVYEDSMIRQQRKPDPEQSLNLLGSQYLSKEALENKIVEKLVDVEYEKFIAVMERIAHHKYGYLAADFISQYRVQLMAEKKDGPPLEPQIAEDGRRFVKITDCKRKRTLGEVTVTMPGTGKFTINGQDINYFTSDQSKHQQDLSFVVVRPPIEYWEVNCRNKQHNDVLLLLSM